MLLSRAFLHLLFFKLERGIYDVAPMFVLFHDYAFHSSILSVVVLPDGIPQQWDFVKYCGFCQRKHVRSIHVFYVSVEPFSGARAMFTCFLSSMVADESEAVEQSRVSEYGHMAKGVYLWLRRWGLARLLTWGYRNPPLCLLLFNINGLTSLNRKLQPPPTQHH